MQIADSSKQETATTSSTLAEPTPQAAPKPEPQAEAKPAPGAQRESKPEPKPGAEAKPETKPETKLAPKPEPKPEPKPKPAPKPSSAATQPAQPQSKPPSTASAPPSAATKPPAPAPLDLASLEERLKETSAIGLLTKLSLKNQVDDLVGEFRAYHRGVRPPTLSQLRPAFELLLMKVLSLLQDRDPKLAHDVSTSRDAIWGVLVDPHKLAEFS